MSAPVRRSGFCLACEGLPVPHSRVLGECMEVGTLRWTCPREGCPGTLDGNPADLDPVMVRHERAHAEAEQHDCAGCAGLPFAGLRLDAEGWIERCEVCNRYTTDHAAASALCALGLPVACDVASGAHYAVRQTEKETR